MSERAAEGPAPRTALLVSRWPRVYETFVLDEVLELERRGFECRVLAMGPSSEPCEHRRLREMRAEVGLLSAGRRPIRALASMARALGRGPLRFADAARAALAFRRPVARLAQACVAADLLRSGDADLLQAHFIDPAEIASVASRLLGVPFCVHLHGRFVEDRPPKGFDRVLEGAAAVVTDSAFTKGVLERLYGRRSASKIHCVYNSVSRAFLDAVPRRMDGPPVVVSVGRLVPTKGHESLVRACGRLRRRGFAFRCEIVGDGEGRPALEALIRAAGLRGTVSLRGALPQEEVLDCVRSADIFAMPSEGVGAPYIDDEIPRAIMEAMALGLCPLSTPVGGVPELIEHGVTGLLVPEGDEEAFAESLERLLTDADLRGRLARAARAKIRRLCDPDEHSCRIAALLRGAAGFQEDTRLDAL